MIRSMTGFGRAQGSCHGLELSVELNAVNRRNLEISVSLPREWQTLERDIQHELRGMVNRGKIHVTMQAVPAAAEGGFHWEADGLESSLRRLGEVAKGHGIEWPPDGGALIRLAALNKVEAMLPEAGEVRETVLQLVSSATKSLVTMRESEGSAMAADLSDRIASLRNELAAIAEESRDTVSRYRDLLFQRLSQAGLELDLSDERVLKEIALFADKCDTSEEQTRLESHFDQFEESLTAGSPIGRKLDFIVQEMNREVNTIGSKANNIEVSRRVIEAKNEIERIREQIQNIE